MREFLTGVHIVCSIFINTSDYEKYQVQNYLNLILWQSTFQLKISLVMIDWIVYESILDKTFNLSHFLEVSIWSVALIIHNVFETYLSVGNFWSNLFPTNYLSIILLQQTALSLVWSMTWNWNDKLISFMEIYNE